MTNDAVRRFLCCSENLDEQTKIGIMEDYARTLKRSGYSERFRHEVISDAMRCHQKMLKTEAEGGRPVDRPRDYQPQERRRRREEKRERFYRKEPRGSRVREHTCKKRVMWRRWLFWPKKLAEKVRKSRQNVNRDKSA